MSTVTRNAIDSATKSRAVSVGPVPAAMLEAEAVLERTFMDPFGRVAIVGPNSDSQTLRPMLPGFQFAAIVLKSGLIELIVLVVLILIVTGTSYLVERRKRRR